MYGVKKKNFPPPPPPPKPEPIIELPEPKYNIRNIVIYAILILGGISIIIYIIYNKDQEIDRLKKEKSRGTSPTDITCNCPKCPKCPKAPSIPKCPKCPECPTTICPDCPTTNDIISSLFPGRAMDINNAGMPLTEISDHNLNESPDLSITDKEENERKEKLVKESTDIMTSLNEVKAQVNNVLNST